MTGPCYWFEGTSLTGISSRVLATGLHARPHPPTPSPSWRGGAMRSRLNTCAFPSACIIAFSIQLFAVSSPSPGWRGGRGVRLRVEAGSANSTQGMPVRERFSHVPWSVRLRDEATLRLRLRLRVRVRVGARTKPMLGAGENERERIFYRRLRCLLPALPYGFAIIGEFNPIRMLFTGWIVRSVRFERLVGKQH